MNLFTVSNKEQLIKVWKLTHDVYVSKGYAQPQPDGILRHYPELDEIPETVVFGVEYQDRLLGTISGTIDGPKGLNVDYDFKDIMDRERRIVKKALAMWRFVSVPEFRNAADIAFGLIHRAIHYAVENDVDYSYMVINPKHKKFYQKRLAFEAISEVRKEHSVNESPGILMKTKIEDLIGHLMSYYKAPHS